MECLRLSKNLRQPFQGNPVPLDTEPVPVETGSDTPGFAPDGAGRGQKPRLMSLVFENFKSLCSTRKLQKGFFDSLKALQMECLVLENEIILRLRRQPAVHGWTGKPSSSHR